MSVSQLLKGPKVLYNAVWALLPAMVVPDKLNIMVLAVLMMLCSVALADTLPLLMIDAVKLLLLLVGQMTC